MLTRVTSVVEPVFFEVRHVPDNKTQHKKLLCPHCQNQPLAKAEHPRDSSVIIDYCSQCKGIWLDKGELEAIREENILFIIGRFFKWIIGLD